MYRSVIWATLEKNRFFYLVKTSSLRLSLWSDSWRCLLCFWNVAIFVAPKRKIA